MELSFETLEITVHDPKITVVMMNRPSALNAMNTQMMRELRDVFQEFYVDPSPRPTASSSRAPVTAVSVPGPISKNAMA